MLGRLIRWILLVAGGLALAGVAMATVARFSDGPIFVFPGGPLRSGELASFGEADWDALGEAEEIEFQLMEPSRSRLTWLVVLDGRPYVPCGFCDNHTFKRWPRQIEADDRVLLRIAGDRYPGRARRVGDGELWERLKQALVAKYAAYQDAQPGQLWFYRVVARDPEEEPGEGGQTWVP